MPAIRKVYSFIQVVLLIPFLLLGSLSAQQALDSYESHSFLKYEVIINSEAGKKIKIRPYTNTMLRVQFSLEGKPFFDDKRYEMIERHDMGGELTLVENNDHLLISTFSDDGITLKVLKKS